MSSMRSVSASAVLCIVIGTLTEDGTLVVNDREFDNSPVDMPMDMLLGNPPKMTRERGARCGSPKLSYSTCPA